MATTVDRGREAFDQRAWRDAFAHLSAVDDNERLPAEDLERLGVAAFLIGRDEASEVSWERAHREWLRDMNLARAARSAFWLAFGLLDRGEMTRGEGWLARPSRLLEENDLDCVERATSSYLWRLRRVAENEVARRRGIHDLGADASGALIAAARVRAVDGSAVAAP